MEFHGVRGLAFKDVEESRFFERSVRLTGTQLNLVRYCYTEEAHTHLSGAAWKEKGKSSGHQRLALLYATIDSYYRDERIKKGDFTQRDVDETVSKYGAYARFELPLPDQEILDLWRQFRKAPKPKTGTPKPTPRRTKAFEKKTTAARNPSVVFTRIVTGFPNRTMLDEEVLRQVASIIADAHEIAFQAEALKDEDGMVPMERLQDFTKLMDQYIKLQQAASALMKQHGYDYGTRKRMREAATAAEIFADVAAHGESLFDARATEVVCEHCKLSFGYVMRHFITIQYNITVVNCPRCHHSTTVVMEALRDEIDLV